MKSTKQLNSKQTKRVRGRGVTGRTYINTAGDVPVISHAYLWEHLLGAHGSDDPGVADMHAVLPSSLLFAVMSALLLQHLVVSSGAADIPQLRAPQEVVALSTALDLTPAQAEVRQQHNSTIQERQGSSMAATSQGAQTPVGRSARPACS
jgi:hypothetical protein